MSDITLSKAVRTNLLSLQSTADMMAKTQERLATGNKVNSALDNPTNFFTASSLNSRASDLNALMDSMSNGIKTLEAADNGITSITKTLESMQSTLRQARQDKSFQNNVYDVTADSVLTLMGGQFDTATEIKLGTATPGTKAELKTASEDPYVGPSTATGTQQRSTSDSATGIGARSVLTTTGNGLVDGAVVKVAGLDIVLTGTANANPTPTQIRDQINAQLNAVGAQTNGAYTVTVGTGANQDKIIIEAVDPRQPAPTVSFTSGATMATKAATTFNYSAIQSNVTIGSGPDSQIVSTGSTFDQFVANLEAKATAGKYRVVADNITQTVTLEALEFGDTAPVVTGVNANAPATAAVTRTNLTGIAVADPTGSAMVIDGISLDISGTSALADLKTRIEGAITSNATLNAKYTAVLDANTGELTLTDKTTGNNRTQAQISFTGLTTQPTTTTVSFTQGTNQVTGGATTIPEGDGVFLDTVDAASDKFSINYDNKTVEIALTGIKGGIGTVIGELDTKNWQDATIERVNAELKNGGITGLEAKFDADGRFSIVAREPEAKSLAIYGTRGVELFGNNNVVTGTATVDGYSAKAPVDKFVEEINRTYGDKLRASNDNGKLRIENLSTAELDVNFDADGAGPISVVNSKIKGNAVRENLALQFNDLKNQLDRLSDDASFNGINLLRGDNLKITFNENGSSFIDVQTQGGRGINASSLNIQNLIGRDLDTDGGIDQLLDEVKLALSDMRSQASKFGSNLSIVQNRQEFTKKMINTLETGAANLTLADMNEEAANLLALQTRQSLSSSSLSLASQADQSILQLLQ